MQIGNGRECGFARHFAVAVVNKAKKGYGCLRAHFCPDLGLQSCLQRKDIIMACFALFNNASGVPAGGDAQRG